MEVIVDCTLVETLGLNFMIKVTKQEVDEGIQAGGGRGWLRGLNGRRVIEHEEGGGKLFQLM